MNRFRDISFSGKVKLIVSTFFFVGYCPIAPGTAGTAAGIPLYLLVSLYASPLVYIVVTTFIAGLAVWASDFAEEYYAHKDPSQVVIDEIAGFMLAMLFIEPSLFTVVLAFVIFRILDIIKIPPARTVEKLKGGAGIVADDLVSGFYTNIVMQLVLLASILF